MASIAEDRRVDEVLERRYLALVHVARTTAGAPGWPRLATAAGEALDVALGVPGNPSAGVRLWAATADGLDELARHPGDHLFPHASPLELRRAAESAEPVPGAGGGVLAALRADAGLVGVIQVDHPEADADLVADLAPLIAGRAGALARSGAGDVLVAPLPDELSDADALMAAFAMEARRELDHDRLSAYLLACEGRAFERFAVATSPAAAGEGVIIPFEELGLRHVVVTNRALVAADLATDPRIVGREDRVIARAGFHGLVSVPLRLHGRPIGVLNFVSRTRGFYREEDIPLAQKIADQIAAFVGNLQVQSRLRTLIRHEAVERERTRVGRDLYHVVAQTVPEIERLGGELRELGARDAATAERAVRIQELARQALADSRRAVADVTPRILDAQSLEAAARASLAAMEHDGLRCRLNVAGDASRLPGGVRRGALRILQEALTNVRQHARARNVQVTLQCGRDLMLSVEDDGTGYQPHEADRGDGLGLQFMAERAQALGGTLAIRSVPGGGTVVRFELLGAGEGRDAASAPAEAPVPPPAATLRVFVADRHPLVRAGVARLLERGGDVRVVGDAATAGEVRGQVRRLRPDVLLVESGLAQADGDALVRDVRTQSPGTAVVVLSESPTGRDAELVEAGASGCVLKAVGGAELAEAVRAAAAGAVLPPADATSSVHATTLTPRERTILALMAAGCTNSEIGRTLFLATKTVERQLATIVRKLGARNRAHATALAVARHMVDPPDA